MATTTLPAGWSLLATRNREDLHQALLTSTCDRAFADVPVDCWDEAAGVWRPTSIVSVLGGVWDVRRDVEVLTPGLEGTSVRRASIADVRLSRLLTAGVSRYWIARYQRRLVRDLIGQSAAPAAELDSLHDLAARFRHEEALGYDTWATAYGVGAPEQLRHEPDLPAHFDDGVAEVVGNGRAALIQTAVGMLAADLLMIDASLEEAGATAAERAAHPLLVLITSLLLRAPVVQGPLTPAESGPPRA